MVSLINKPDHFEVCDTDVDIGSNLNHNLTKQPRNQKSYHLIKFNHHLIYFRKSMIFYVAALNR